MLAKIYYKPVVRVTQHKIYNYVSNPTPVPPSPNKDHSIDLTWKGENSRTVSENAHLYHYA